MAANSSFQAFVSRVQDHSAGEMDNLEVIDPRGVEVTASSDVGSVVQSALEGFAVHCEIQREFKALEDSRDETNEECLKARPDLEHVTGCIPTQLLHDRGLVGRYFRAQFYLLWSPVCLPKVQIVAPAGSGKTTLVIEGLQSWAERVVWILLPNHRMIQQVVQDFRSHGFRHAHAVYGRTAQNMCLRNDPTGLSQQLSALRRSVQQVLCGNPENEGPLCPHFADCPYQLQRETLSELELPSNEPIILVMAHQYLVSWPSFLPKPDLVVIDEKHWQVFLQQESIWLSTLKQQLEPEFGGGKNPEAERALSAICEGIASNCGLIAVLRRHGLADSKALSRLITLIESVIQELTSHMKPDMPEVELKRALGSPRLQHLGATLSLVKTLQTEIRVRGCDAAEARSISYPNVAAFGKKNDCVGIHSRRYSPAKSLPVLMLDATADERVNARIWGDSLETKRVLTRRNALIFQVRRKAFSRQSILGRNAFDQPLRPDEAAVLRAEIEGFLTARARTHGRLLVVAQRRVVKHWLNPWKASLPEDLSQRIQVAHFGALRGLNEFEECDAAVIIGREQPSPGGLEAQARALYFDASHPLSLGRPFWRVSSTRRFLGDEQEREVIVRHLDPYIDALREQICERELEQAFDRLRLIHNVSPKVVYLLTNVPVNAGIAASATWANFVDPLKSRVGQAVSLAAERCKGLPAVAIPVGYRELARVFPSIWSKAVQARHDVLDHSGGSPEKVPLFQIVMLFGNGVPLLVEYRRVRQRGKSSRAIVFFPQEHSRSISDRSCRTALERIVGPVAWLDVQPYPGLRYSIDPAPLREEAKQ